MNEGEDRRRLLKCRAFIIFAVTLNPMTLNEKIVTVVGGVNIDISATLTNPLVTADSNPGRVMLGCGGVARNIAYNLHLLGVTTKLITLFGGDTFGKISYGECRAVGLDVSLSEHLAEERNGLYLCVNNHGGEMIVAVADTDIIAQMTPDFLARRLDVLNSSAAVVADTNISEQALAFLLSHCQAPLMVDAVSTAKARRATAALRLAEGSRLHTLKLNEKEALSVTCRDSVASAAEALIEMGVDNVYITLGANGLYATDGSRHITLPSLPAEVVNTTGAGDAFLAGVVFAQVNGADMTEAARCGLETARAALMSPEAVNPDIASIVNFTSK